MNFICNTRAMANYKPLLVAQDNSLHTHITERKLPIASFLGSHINVSSFSRATNFYEGSGFARVSMMKVISVRAILESGRDVMFSDVDIAFAREPLQYFKGDVDFEVTMVRIAGISACVLTSCYAVPKQSLDARVHVVFGAQHWILHDAIKSSYDSIFVGDGKVLRHATRHG